jgi:ATP-dependent protease HslVU (ClpYQ) peptidase subunit
MTCIVAVRDKRGVVMGGDSCAAFPGWEVTAMRDRKVFRNGAFVIGYTDSFRMGQLLEFMLKPGDPPRREADLRRFMVVDFAERVREVVKTGGYARIENNTEGGGQFIVAVRGRLFLFEPAFDVVEPAEPFLAVGCGQNFALGALRALPPRMSAQARCAVALRVAADSSGGVMPPFHFERSTL